MKLFAIYIGGEFPGANVEVHDVRFVVANSLAETYATLRQQWWGVPRSLHIDCWAEVTHADGYDVSLKEQPYQGSEKLFFVNLGGYEPGTSRSDTETFSSLRKPKPRLSGAP
ncbi:DUF1543 domain-containing protein [Novosphingobium sp. 9]|uniref:DUF1543 domain-containing protein n=1 Tax=Novosphingobium sp. 9 TaxID=2025349 RepID=UPI0021B5D767|nr:DUF1543 domain-containing protein [Novosphingobium sp. 9]